jgi:carbamate kinase
MPNLLTLFRCKHYPDLGRITYRFCLGRQNVKTIRKNPVYPECANCKQGKKIAKIFKGYKPMKVSHTNAPKVNVKKYQKIRKDAKDNNNISLDNLELIIKAQVSYIFQKAKEGKLQGIFDKVLTNRKVM